MIEGRADYAKAMREWVTQRISLADLDIPATTKANDDRGVDFRVPGGAGQ